MKKKIFIAIMLVSAFALFGNNIIKPKVKTFKCTAKDGLVYYIYVTETYSSEYWAEAYLVYEDNIDLYDEAEANKHIYEFISWYKHQRKFSRISVEDLKDATEGDKDGKIIIQKRLILENIRK